MLDVTPFDPIKIYEVYILAIGQWLQTYATPEHAAFLLFGAIVFAVGARAVMLGAAAILISAGIEFYALAAVPEWVAPLTMLLLTFGLIQFVAMAFLGTDTGGNFLSSVLIAAIILVLMAPWRVISKFAQWRKK